MDRSANIEKNKKHYDELYAQIDVDSVVKTVSQADKFLADATRTDTSWHGLYQENFAKKLPGKRVLELGCGDGRNALLMAALGADVVAVDISEGSEIAIRKAADQLKIENITPITGDFTLLDFEKNSFDFIVGKAFLHHLTHDLESDYLKKMTELLKADGEVRFFEPAVNNKWFDKLRWIVPVPGRPSSLNRKAFQAYHDADAHPDRDNSSGHYRQAASRYFGKVKITPLGSIERYCRLMPNGNFRRRYRRWAHRVERYIPLPLRFAFARSQVIICHQPVKEMGK